MGVTDIDKRISLPKAYLLDPLALFLVRYLTYTFSFIFSVSNKLVIS